jgi:hypothetical protein
MGPNQYYYLSIINFLTTILQKTKSNDIKLDGKDSIIPLAICVIISIEYVLC